MDGFAKGLVPRAGTAPYAAPVPRLVLMCGLAGSGKSTCARGLEERGWTRFSVDAELWGLGLRDQDVPADVDEIRRRLSLRRGAHADDVVVPPELLDRYVAGFEAPGLDEPDVRTVAPIDT